jgi:hypothetical protein
MLGTTADISLTKRVAIFFTETFQDMVDQGLLLGGPDSDIVELSNLNNPKRKVRIEGPIMIGSEAFIAWSCSDGTGGGFSVCGHEGDSRYKLDLYNGLQSVFRGLLLVQ